MGKTYKDSGGTKYPKVSEKNKRDPVRENKRNKAKGKYSDNGGGK